MVWAEWNPLSVLNDMTRVGPRSLARLNMEAWNE